MLLAVALELASDMLLVLPAMSSKLSPSVSRTASGTTTATAVAGRLHTAVAQRVELGLGPSRSGCSRRGAAGHPRAPRWTSGRACRSCSGRARRAARSSAAGSSRLSELATYLHKARGDQDDLADHGVVRDHHSAGPEERLQVWRWQSRSTCCASSRAAQRPSCAAATSSCATCLSARALTAANCCASCASSSARKPCRTAEYSWRWLSSWPAICSLCSPLCLASSARQCPGLPAVPRGPP